MVNRTTRDQALERTRVASTYGTSANAREAAETIKSLPDHIIDGDQLHHIIQNMNESVTTTVSNEWERGYDHATRYWRNLLTELLNTPPQTGTLADMTPEERNQSQWMWADTTENTPERVIITQPGHEESEVLNNNGHTRNLDNNKITPRPDLDPITWQDTEPENTPDKNTTTPDLDPALVYQDADGHNWYHIDGKWKWHDPHTGLIHNQWIEGDTLAQSGPFTIIGTPATTSHTR